MCSVSPRPPRPYLRWQRRRPPLRPRRPAPANPTPGRPPHPVLTPSRSSGWENKQVKQKKKKRKAGGQRKAAWPRAGLAAQPGLPARGGRGGVGSARTPSWGRLGVRTGTRWGRTRPRSVYLLCQPCRRLVYLLSVPSSTGSRRLPPPPGACAPPGLAAAEPGLLLPPPPAPPPPSSLPAAAARPGNPRLAEEDEGDEPADVGRLLLRLLLLLPPPSLAAAAFSMEPRGGGCEPAPAAAAARARQSPDSQAARRRGGARGRRGRAAPGEGTAAPPPPESLRGVGRLLVPRGSAGSRPPPRPPRLPRAGGRALPRRREARRPFPVGGCHAHRRGDTGRKGERRGRTDGLRGAERRHTGAPTHPERCQAHACRVTREGGPHRKACPGRGADVGTHTHAGWWQWERVPRRDIAGPSGVWQAGEGRVQHTEPGKHRLHPCQASRTPHARQGKQWLRAGCTRRNTERRMPRLRSIGLSLTKAVPTGPQSVALERGFLGTGWCTPLLVTTERDSKETSVHDRVLQQHRAVPTHSQKSGGRWCDRQSGTQQSCPPHSIYCCTQCISTYHISPIIHPDFAKNIIVG